MVKKQIKGENDMMNTAKRAMLKREMEYVMAYAMIGETEKNCLRRYADYIGKLI